MVRNIFMKSRTVMRLLSMAVICTFLSNGMVWGALQPPLSKIPVPKPDLAAFVKDEAAAIRLGKALFWDMQAGSDGVTACASCHYRAGADPVVGTLPKDTAKRDKNQLHPGPDAIFGNNSTVIKTFVLGAPVNPVTFKPVPLILRATGATRFAPNYTLQTFDFPLFMVTPPTARLVIDPLTGLTSDAVSGPRDTNDVVGSQGVRLADFLAINNGSAVDSGTPLADTTFHIGPKPNVVPANNVRRVTGRNSPSVINAVFNYTNFWDGRANNIFNGVNPFGPLDQGAGIYIDNGGGLPLVKQAVAIPNSSLASQATGPPLDHTEMSFNGRTFPELGRKMLSLTPLGLQHVHPNDSILGAPLANAGQGLNTNYRNMIVAAFQDNLTGNKPISLPTKAVPFPGGESFTQIEANFSLFWGLAIQLYEATLVSDRAPFDRFQLGNKNALSPDQANFPLITSAVRGFGLFDSKCAVCHSGSEFSSAVVGSNNCLATTRVADPNACNAVAFTNNSTHNLIKQAVPIPEAGVPTPPPPSLFDAGFFNIGVRPTADNPGRGGSVSFIDPVTQNTVTYPLSFSQLAKETGLPFVTPKLPAGFTTIDKVQGSFKTPGLRNVELTAPYFHNGDALDLDQVVEFYARGGNFPGNPGLAINMQPFNFRNDPFKRADIVAFLNTLTDERVRNETAPFDHPELKIPNGVDAGADAIITLPATGGAAPDVPINNFTLNPVVATTNLTSLLLSGTVDALEIVNNIPTVVFDKATVAVDVTNTTTGASLLTAAVATVGGTVAGVVGGVVQLAGKWSINLTGLTPGFHTITVTATSITGGTMTLPVANIQITPTATIIGAPSASGTKQNSAVLTIGGGGVDTYQFSVDGGAFNGVDLPLARTIVLTSLRDGAHTVAVLAKDVGRNQQLIPTTATWIVKANLPVLTIAPFAKPTNKTSLTIGGTVELGSTSSLTVTVDPPATAGTVNTIGGIGVATWSCDINGLAPGANNIKISALDFVFNQAVITDVLTAVVPDGNFEGTGPIDIRHALKALRIAVGIDALTPDDLLRGDVAPLVNGKPAPDDKIDISDAIVILKKVVGLITF